MTAIWDADGSSGRRVTSERIGRDLNPLGRGDGNAYVGGAQNYGRIAPRLPKSSGGGGWGNTVNNGCGGCGGGGFSQQDTPPSELPPGDPPPSDGGDVPSYCPRFPLWCCDVFKEGLSCCAPPECEIPGHGYTTACLEHLNDACAQEIEDARAGKYGYSTDGTYKTCEPSPSDRDDCEVWTDAAFYSFADATKLGRCLPLLTDPIVQACLVRGMNSMKDKQEFDKRMGLD